jgi:Tol biopolymer transport system component
VWVGIAAVAVISLAAVLKPFGRDAAPSGPAMWLDVRVAESTPIFVDENVDGAVAVISPDGQRLAYLGASQNGRRLYIRRLDSAEVTPLAGTDGATSHFFSPDSKWLAFFAEGQLKKVAVSGGAPVKVADAPDGRGGAWGPNDVIVFAPETTTGLHRVSAGGGTAEPITTRGEKERTHRWPTFIPGTDTVVFISQAHDAAYDDASIEAVHVGTKARKVLVRGGTYPRYLASGHLAYVRENTLFAVPLDAAALEVTGAAQPVLSSVMSSRGVGAGVGDGSAQIAVSDNGTAIMISGEAAPLVSELVVTDRNGKPVYTYPEKREFRSPRFSPDGNRIAVQMSEGRHTHVFVLELARGTLTRVTFDGTMNGTPAWSRDGRLLAFFSDRHGNGLNVFTVRSDGAGEPTVVTTATNINVPFSFAPDDKSILGMQQGNSSSALDVVLFSRADKTVTPILKSPANEVLPVFSPDGKWIAYASDETSREEIYIRPFPVQGGRWVVSADGGMGPVWTKQGRELIYLGGRDFTRLTAVEVSVKDGAIRPGKPQVLFEYPVAHPANGSWMDANADGTRFVLLREDATQRRPGYTHVTLITNFFEHVRKTVR